MSICGIGRSLTIDTSLLLDANAASSQAIWAGLKTQLINPGSWRLRVGTKGQFPGDFAPSLANRTPRYYWHCSLPVFLLF